MVSITPEYRKWILEYPYQLNNQKLDHLPVLPWEKQGTQWFRFFRKHCFRSRGLTNEKNGEMTPPNIGRTSWFFYRCIHRGKTIGKLKVLMCFIGFNPCKKKHEMMKILWTIDGISTLLDFMVWIIGKHQKQKFTFGWHHGWVVQRWGKLFFNRWRLRNSQEVGVKTMGNGPIPSIFQRKQNRCFPKHGSWFSIEHHLQKMDPTM